MESGSTVSISEGIVKHHGVSNESTPQPGKSSLFEEEY